jgi:hypothetical protein
VILCQIPQAKKSLEPAAPLLQDLVCGSQQNQENVTRDLLILQTHSLNMRKTRQIHSRLYLNKAQQLCGYCALFYIPLYAMIFFK